MDDIRRWWSYLLWIVALGVGIGFGSSALFVLNSLDTLIETSSMPAAESIPYWSVPQPEFVLPILQSLGPWLAPNPDIEAIIELDAMLWEDISTLGLYARCLEMQQNNSILDKKLGDRIRASSVPYPEFVLPILQTLGPRLVVNPDITMLWENIETLQLYGDFLLKELLNRIQASVHDLSLQLNEEKREEIRKLGKTKRTKLEERARAVWWVEEITGDEFFGFP